MIAWLVVALVAGGCSAPSRPASVEDRARQTITRYNEVLTQGYRSMNMNPMQEVATLTQAESEYIHMSSLAEGGVRLDPTLQELKFVKVSIETTTARVETRETWDYRHYGRADGKLLLEQKDLVYHLAYDLEKQSDDRWLVSDVRAISATSTTEPTRIATPTAIPPEL